MHDLVPAAQAAPPAAPLSPLESFQPLAKHADAPKRVDHIACVSAGYKDERGLPVASRNGILYLHDVEGRAAGLAAILEQNKGRFLTIAVPTNNPEDWVHQSYRVETKTRLVAFGDRNGFTVLPEKEGGVRRHVAAGTAEYKQLVAQAKVSTNISFFLADFDETGRPRVIFPDGFGCYRLRTTSPNTVDNLLHCLRQLARWTGGQVAGLPLRVTLGNRNLSGPTGDKRQAPVMAFAMVPRPGFSLDSETFAAIATRAPEVASLGMDLLPAPPTVDDAVEEFRQLHAPLDAAAFRGEWFAVLGEAGHPAAVDKEARRELIAELTDGVHVDGLAAFLEDASEEEATRLMAALRRHLDGVDANGELSEEAAAAAVAEQDVIDAVATPVVDPMKAELARVGWTKAQAQAWAGERFKKTSADQLTAEERAAMLAHLRGLPTPGDEEGAA